MSHQLHNETTILELVDGVLEELESIQLYHYLSCSYKSCTGEVQSKTRSLTQV